MERSIFRSTLAIALGYVVLLGVAIFILPRLLYPPLSAGELHGITSASQRIDLQHARYQLQSQARGQLVQGLAVLFVAAGAAAAWQQIKVAREGQITERFTRAVNQLGSRKLDVRIGGLYALERIARNSPEDRATIQRVLGAFVRSHAPWPAGSPDVPQHPTDAVDQALPWLQTRAPDVQAAMLILARRPPSRDAPILYLSRTDLRSADLTRAQLSDAHIRHANFARAWMPHCSLERAQLNDTDLRQANLQGGNLSNAVLRGAHLQEANLSGAILTQADLRGANLRNARLEKTQLAGAQHDQTTIWPDDHTAAGT
jgi:hypothetical protein